MGLGDASQGNKVIVVQVKEKKKKKGGSTRYITMRLLVNFLVPQ